MTQTAQHRPTSVQDLEDLVGVELGPTEWHVVDQAAIDGFADLTGDHQWIHVDPARAADSPFGSTIAHGLYSLSRTPAFFEELMAFDGFTHSLNYGYEKVRFPAPLPVGAWIRMHAKVLSVQDLGGGEAHFVTRQTFERKDLDKPVCVAESVARFAQR